MTEDRNKVDKQANAVLRGIGYVELRNVWVHDNDVEKMKRYAQKLNIKRIIFDSQNNPFAQPENNPLKPVEW